MALIKANTNKQSLFNSPLYKRGKSAVRRMFACLPPLFKVGQGGIGMWENKKQLISPQVYTYGYSQMTLSGSR